MKINFKKHIIRLLILAFSLAAMSDIIYGKTEIAKEYLIGQFISQIFSLSITFITILCLISFMFNVFFKDFLENMFYTGRVHSGSENEFKKETKKRRKKK